MFRLRWYWVVCLSMFALFVLHHAQGCSEVLVQPCQSTSDCSPGEVCKDKSCQTDSTQSQSSKEIAPQEPAMEAPQPEPSEEPQPEEKAKEKSTPEPEVGDEPQPEAGPETGPEPEPQTEETPEPEVTPEKPPFLPTWTDNPCANQSNHPPGYSGTVAKWNRQDAISQPPANGLLVIGSSSIRLWKRIQRDLTEWQVIQRGYGGSLLWDTVAHASKIVIPYKPRAILIYAGTNDVSKGTSPDEVLVGYRCLVEKVKKGLGDVPIAFIGITPNPARWGQWSKSTQLNNAVKKLADAWPGLYYIDIATPFLKTGQPPDASLFVGDRLHLNAKGYTLWTSTIKPVLRQMAPPLSYSPPKGQPSIGSRVLIDFGPNNKTDGNHTKSPDSQGQHWNNWHTMPGNVTTLPGEAIGLKTSTNQATPWRIELAGSFNNNGLRNGGLQNPDQTKLGNLAISTATQDYFFITKGDSPQGFTITGLDPKRKYTLRLFASRATDAETRRTKYIITSASGEVSQVLRTTGKDIGSDGSYDGNNNTIVTFDDQKPDAHGKLHIDISVDQGSFGYLALLEIIVK